MPLSFVCNQYPRRIMTSNAPARLLRGGLLLWLTFCVGGPYLAAGLQAHPVAPSDLHLDRVLSPPDTVFAPDFALRTLDGVEIRLSELRGRVVVLNFWATWCSPCRREIPEFVALQNHFGTEDVLFLGISLDDEGPEVVRAFAEEMGVNYPILIDDGSANAAYGPIAALPVTFFVGRDGTVHGYAPGMVTRTSLQPILEALVVGRSLPRSGGER